MKFGQFLISLVVAIACLSGVVWFARRGEVSLQEKYAEARIKAIQETLSKTPKISPTGPWPHLECENRHFEFGGIEVGEKQTHVFKIRNTGKAPLELVKGESTCKCTVAELKDGSLPPDGETEIALEFSGVSPNPMYRQMAQIFTNDPDLPVLELSVQGSVASRFIVSPSILWATGEVGTEAAEISGAIFSQSIDSFKITEIKCLSNSIKFEIGDLPSDLMDSRGAKCGYSIKATVEPTVSAGTFKIPVSVITDSRSKTKDGAEGDPIVVMFDIVGSREGPVKFVGPAWLEQVSGVRMGTFSATEGRKEKVTMLVRNVPEEGLQIKSIRAEPEYLKAEVIAEESATLKSGKRFTLHVEFPPGSPRETYGGEKPARLFIETNHPDAGTIAVSVFFNAY